MIIKRLSRLSRLSLEQSIRLKSFGLTQSSVSVEGCCIIEFRYELQESKYIIYDLDLLDLYIFKNLLLVSAIPLVVVKIPPLNTFQCLKFVLNEH